MYGWSDSEWLTLQFGPVWLASSLIGRSRFDERESDAFWRAVEETSADSSLSWQLTRAMVRNRDWLLDEFMLDDRSIVSGLGHVTALLERVPSEVSRDVREVMLRTAATLARARGPFGQRISDQDAQMLTLVGQLLESSEETARNNPLNATAAI